ncbi:MULTISPECIES: ferrous iron transport protein B [Caloramator]|uniref:Ferrous iron transport protein B n=1 Tax=Caloramator proteoclasticus DSM 10124 TaxID=1121262 RepID=A0A1M4VDT0_9CLOT|nr:MULTISPECIES: ferrous iron transport protein B [Caloramator]SHE67095.1 ferrous iron transport protein B [Caloramator proteoclasticus DSM 10124]
MDCCSGIKIDIPKGFKKLVLAGNPNVGKSVFFNALTGMYVDVSNFPGTTVDVSHGKFENYVVIDTPGVYGVSSFNDEERVARDVILYGDVILNVVDALHLERDLFLTLQIIDMGKPVIVALNMMDDVERNGIKIDIDKLSELLGVPVIPTVAVKGRGLEEVKNNIKNAKVGNIDNKIKEYLEEYKNKVEHQSEALMLLEDDDAISERLNIKTSGKREEIYRLRRERVDKIVESVIIKEGKGNRLRQKISSMTLNPITGIPILVVVLYLVFKVIGVWVAGDVVGVTEETIMVGYYEPFIRNIILKIFNQNTFMYRLLAGEFGILTLTPTYVIGLLTPLVIAFYFFMSLMEDSGYLPRIAALVDRVLSFFGLNGRAIIPIILGFGCITMATITTRLLGTKREKIIATILLGFTIPCSAQLGVIAGMIAPLGTKYILIYAFTILIVFALTGTILNKTLPGESSELFIDLPPMRLPKISNVLKKTWTKTIMFLKEATPLFALGALIITLLEETKIIYKIQDVFKPITESLLRLPKEAANAFIMGIIRRDFGAAGLTELSLTPEQTVVALVTITLFVPCIASIIVIFKERSKKEAALIWLGSFVLAFLVGGVLAFLIV